MPFDLAMAAPVDSLSTDDLWCAVIAIGTRKLAMRQARCHTRLFDALRPLNARIDALQREDEFRRLRR